MGKRAPALRKQSHARLNVLKYIIYGMYMSGDTVSDICSEVVKPDGASPSGVAVRSAIAFVVARGGIAFAGSLKHPGGRPRATSTTLDRKIIKTVFKYRGKAKVTVEFLQKVIREARAVPRRTLSKRLVDVGLAWLRRRRKSSVASVYKPARLDWARWVLTKQTSTLSRWMYTDGTTFYLARTQSEAEQKSRLALGPYVWRMADGSDGRHGPCVAP